MRLDTLTLRTGRRDEYRTSYDWARRRFVQVLGVQRYNELMAGHEVVLDNGQRLALAEH